VVGVLAAGCTTGSTQPNNRQQSQDAIKQRAATYAKAVDQIPTPNITNFPRRKTLVEAVLRQSAPNHPWYVYVLGQNGNVVNYFVAKSVPVNDCDYLSNTEAPSDHWESTVVLSAPSLEGIYQSASGCETLTFFDATTNAEIQVTGMQTYIADRPLKVSAEPIKVR